jgi:hypothetical protein
MAEKILNTRILMKVDTLENWSVSTLPLKKGELAFATVAATAGNGLTEPVVMVKIGEDGVKTFKDLPWNFYAKASDVIAAAKSEDTLRSFVNGVISDAGIASNSAMEALAGRVTTAEGEIDTLQSEMDAVEAKAAANETAIGTLNGLVGDTKVATQISNAIAALDLANTYEAKGEAAKVSTALETYKNSNDAKILEHTNAISANTGAIAAIKDGTTIDSFADVETALAGKETAGAAAQALADAKVYADGLAGNYDAKGAAATAEANAKAYADGLAKNYDAAGTAAQALTDAKAYTDSEMTRLVGDKTVGTQITDALANYTNTSGMNTAIATAKGEAVAHADGLNTAMDTRVKAVEDKAHTHSFVESELNLIKAGDVEKWNAAEQNAKDYADGLDGEMDTRVKALEAKFGTGEGNVESQIAAAVAAEAELRAAADKALQDQIGAASTEGVAATGLHADIERLEGLVGDTKVSEAIASAVATEKERAEGIEAGLEARLAVVEGDYLKGADKTELEGKITANANAIELLTNGVSAEEVDGVNDLIKYVKDHGTEVTGIKGDIKANSDAIDAIEADYLKAADKTELSGLITGLDTRMGAAETAIGTKAAQADLEALAGRVATVEGDLNTETTGLKARMTAAEADIDALEDLVGDTKVSKQITDVTNPLAERVVALEAVDHEHANKTVLDGIEAADITAWDAKVDAVTAAADSGLKATRTGNAVAIEIDDSITFVFDCGNAGV